VITITGFGEEVHVDVTTSSHEAKMPNRASETVFAPLPSARTYLKLLMCPTGPYGIDQVLTAQRAYLDRLELRGMGFVPVLNQVPTDPIVDLVDRGGECRIFRVTSSMQVGW